jgi:ATP-binding cassette subfamily C protein CydD
VRLDRWLRLARQIDQGRDRAQRSGIAIIALGERLLGPVMVNVAIATGARRALAVGALLSSVFAFRGFLQGAQVARTEARLYVGVVDSVLRQDVLQPSVLPDEEARATLFEGAHAVASLLAEGLPNLCANVVASAAFAVFVLLTQPARVVMVAALAGTGGILLLALSRSGFEEAQRVESSAWVALTDCVSDAFEGRLEIVAGGRADAYTKMFANAVRAWSKAAMRSAGLSSLAGRLPLLVLAVSVGAAVVVDSMLRGEPTSHILSQAALLASMSPAFVGVAQGLQAMAKSERRIQQMLALVTADPSPVRKDTRTFGDVGSVELQAVHFAYERSGRRHYALRGVSFTWRTGQLLALAGPNGSGKSTCLRALLGLGERTAGQVRVDGVPLEAIDIDLWRRRITFLPQRPYLPPRSTVRDCLRFVDADVTEQAMTEALERLGLDLLLRRGGASPLDVGVDELSVGQRQRIGLARVLCRKAPMVVLDEPDANLDEAGIQLVGGLVRELSRDRMVLVSAHSPELLAAADRVVKLDAGQIVANGSDN